MRIDEVCFDDRTNFQRSFLLESPQRRPFESWPGIKNIIQEFIEADPDRVEDVTNTIRKYEGLESVYYWVHDSDKIILGIELSRERKALVVHMTGKDPAYRHNPPYASDLYDAILKDQEKNICLHSDKTLSDEGYDIWKRLYTHKHTVLVYNANDPAYTYKKCPTLADFEQYFGDGKDLRDYSYVLCEGKIGLMNAYSHFHMRQLREDNGID